MFKNKNTELYNHSQTSGFTLIEVLVSLALFTIVVTISITVLLVLIDASARAQNSQSILTNLSFALDSMTREIRTGTDYECRTNPNSLHTDDSFTRDCGNNPGTSLAITEGGQSLTGDASSHRIGYKLGSGSLERKLGDGDWDPVTSSDITIDTLEFFVTGSTRGLTDGTTPTVTIYLSGTVGDEDSTRTPFKIQTTIAQRILDI